MDKIHNYRDDFLAAQWLNGDGHRYSRLVDIKRLIGEVVAKGTFESVNNIEPLIVEHLKGVYIDSFMHDARKIWIPGGHEGSQGYSGGALRILSAATIRALNKEKAEWLADYECDEDEYLEE